MNEVKHYSSYLQRYFDRNWGHYDESAEWHPNPASNIWVFDIREMGIRVTLTCDEYGSVRESRMKIK